VGSQRKAKSFESEVLTVVSNERNEVPQTACFSRRPNGVNILAQPKCESVFFNAALASHRLCVAPTKKPGLAGLLI